jgi:lycopene beta-cyclase
MRQNHFDIIISGAGAAGISLAYRALKEGVWKKQSILIIDNNANTKVEKTWCFWQNDSNHNQDFALESLVFKKWDHFSFYTHDNQYIPLKTKGYQYKMIRSADFFETTLTYLQQQKNVTFISGEATNLESSAAGAFVSVNNALYSFSIL